MVAKIFSTQPPVLTMSSMDPNCSIEALRGERRSFAAYLRNVVVRLESELGVRDESIKELLLIETPDDFLECLLCPNYFLYA